MGLLDVLGFLKAFWLCASLLHVDLHVHVLRLADALREMDSQPVIRAGNIGATNNSEASGAAQNTTMSKKVSNGYR